MRITRYTDYALRVLLYLAVRPDEVVTIRAIAECYGISENHLMKVVHKLGQIGVVQTVRGRGGGLKLARPPEEISLGAVVRATEDDLALVECLDSTANTCPIAGGCGLTGIVNEALAAFLAVLDRYSLADAVCRSRDLERLLKVGV
ncbi:Rrf2 family transcriptional regulator [Telmatospirillum sp. J64-1]|uniref:RrF2 family transcriptional regulator n=1 Tax=Telmatospirillum sp. J64-1 TaxID=2502183 RepID=UPI00115F11EB|nr:Rrf2 family transcriptional regulator [Telmatospirillum sp. J64-1]